MQVFHGDVLRIEPDWRDTLNALDVGGSQDWSTFSGGELISASGDITHCYRCESQDARPVYFKRYVYPRGSRFRYWLRPAKSGVELWAYTRLQELGIPSLDVVAFGERRFLGALSAGCIVTRGISNTVDLATFATKIWCHWPRARRIKTARLLAERLLSQARWAHQNGFFHHDLKWRNLLVNVDGDPGSLVWIDAPRASRMRLRRQRGIVTDLSGLARIAVSLFSRSERMRFLRTYFGKTGDRKGRKRLFRMIDRHLARRPPNPITLRYPD